MLKTSAIGLAGMMFSPRLFSSKRELNSEIVATKVETVMNDCSSIRAGNILECRTYKRG